ncbi:MAG: SRPBCC domain-containing protein [Bacteroidota bacterium]
MEFNIEINAPRKKVWEILWGKESYPMWTKAFSEDSQVETDWQTGSKALFHDGKKNGMVSKIVENVPEQYMSIEHLGMIVNGIEDYDSEEVKRWSGTKENYTLTVASDKTLLRVDMDMDETEENREMIKMFEGMWPKALNNIKRMAEQDEVIPPVVV